MTITVVKDGKGEQKSRQGLLYEKGKSVQRKSPPVNSGRAFVSCLFVYGFFLAVNFRGGYAGSACKEQYCSEEQIAVVTGFRRIGICRSGRFVRIIGVIRGRVGRIYRIRTLGNYRHFDGLNGGSLFAVRYFVGDIINAGVGSIYIVFNDNDFVGQITVFFIRCGNAFAWIELIAHVQGAVRSVDDRRFIVRFRVGGKRPDTGEGYGRRNVGIAFRRPAVIGCIAIRTGSFYDKNMLKIGLMVHKECFIKKNRGRCIKTVQFF